MGRPLCKFQSGAKGKRAAARSRSNSLTSDHEHGKRSVAPLPDPSELYPIFQGTPHFPILDKRKFQFLLLMAPDFALIHSY